MCGILAILENSPITKEALEKLELLIRRRGPDYCSPLVECRTKCGLILKILASILHLRGDKIQEQPVIDDKGNILLFNGNVYGIDGAPLEARELSDTSYISKRLGCCDSREDVAHVMSAIDGPFAFIYWQNALQSLILGKDVFGRKSLCLLESPESRLMAVSSVGSSRIELFVNSSLSWVELDPDSFHCFDYSDSRKSNRTLLPRTYSNQNQSKNKISPLNSDLRLHEEFHPEEHKSALNMFEEILVNAVSKRVRYNRQDCLICRSNKSGQSCDHSKVAVAFSGGIDSTLIALILDRVLSKNETIDLTTVAFKPDSPDRESVASAFRELRTLCPRRNWRLIICDVPLETLKMERSRIIHYLISPRNTVIDDSLGCASWFIGRAKGRALDSLLNDDMFEKMFDKFTEFSSKPRAVDENCDKIQPEYESPATMLFCGSGIDEQLGGYSSHRAAWSKLGTEGVCKEIERQMAQLPFRNLGRDDRIYSDHGRDVKLPYLDNELVSYLNQLPVGLKMNLDEPQDIGPKKLLRNLAYRLGLKITSRRVKRALQFGTRIANLEGSKEKGNDICDRL